MNTEQGLSQSKLVSACLEPDHTGMIMINMLMIMPMMIMPMIMMIMMLALMILMTAMMHHSLSCK